MPESATPAGRFAGKRAVVTGAARGIGRATAARFLAEGAEVLLVDRESIDLSAATAKADGRASGLSLDLAQPGAAQEILAALEGKTLDIW